MLKDGWLKPQPPAYASPDRRPSLTSCHSPPRRGKRYRHSHTTLSLSAQTLPRFRAASLPRCLASALPRVRAATLPCSHASALTRFRAHTLPRSHASALTRFRAHTLPRSIPGALTADTPLCLSSHAHTHIPVQALLPPKPNRVTSPVPIFRQLHVTTRHGELSRSSSAQPGMGIHLGSAQSRLRIHLGLQRRNLHLKGRPRQSRSRHVVSC
jgi:hypothetical protein